VNTAKWDGWAPYVGGSVWDSMISRQSYIDVKPKAAATVAGDSSSNTLWIPVAVAVVVAAGAVVLIVRRRRGRALEE
jgi:hypothetical protein